MTIKWLPALLILTVQSSTPNRVITTLMHSKSYVQPTIVNGKPALYGEVPYLVSLKEPAIEYSSDLTLWRNLCVGSIISRRLVLTAAHCFEDCDFLYAQNWQLLRVVAGADGCRDVLRLENSTKESEQQWRKIEKLVMHEHFAFPNYDIALVRVDKNFIYNDAVYYIPPASYNKGYYGICKCAGFGLDGYRSHYSERASDVVVADIETLSSSRCSQLWEMNMSLFICTKSAISGVELEDSGGPLACYDRSNATEIVRRSLLTGIVGGRNFDNTILYTRVSAYSDWILKHSSSKKIIAPSLCLILIVINIISITLYTSLVFVLPL